MKRATNRPVTRRSDDTTRHGRGLRGDLSEVSVSCVTHRENPDREPPVNADPGDVTGPGAGLARRRIGSRSGPTPLAASVLGNPASSQGCSRMVVGNAEKGFIRKQTEIADAGTGGEERVKDPESEHRSGFRLLRRRLGRIGGGGVSLILREGGRVLAVRDE